MNSPSSFRAQRGVSLIEVMVAIVVLSIGLLGVAGLNVVSLRGTQQAGDRGVAAQLSLEVADLIRANRPVLANWNASPYNNNAVINTNLTATAAAGADCVTATCTPAQQAAYDLTVWAKSITDRSLSGAAQAKAGKLSNASAVVCITSTPNIGTPANPQCDNAPFAPFVVKIWWDERVMNATEQAQAGGNVIQRFSAISFVPPT